VAQFCSAFLQQPDVAEDSRFSSNTKRVQNREALDRVIAEAFARLDSSEALQRLAASNTAYGQVRSVAQMAEHPALRTWPMTVDGEELRMIAPAVRAPWDSQHFDAAPRLGEHTERIRAEFATKQVGEFA
jgi:crotonobetainyl-CoA:carnitine CoA-transferase CaiB-like acyl-CoA transferase